MDPESSTEHRNKRKKKQWNQKVKKFSLLRMKEMILIEYGIRAMVSSPSDHPSSLYLSDVMDMLISTVLGNYTVVVPRWSNIDDLPVEKTLLLLIDGISVQDYVTYKDRCPILKNKFGNCILNTILPKQYSGDDIIETLAVLPVLASNTHCLVSSTENLKMSLKRCLDYSDSIRAIFSIKGDIILKDSPVDDKFSRTSLILTPADLQGSGYPVIYDDSTRTKYGEYVFTKDEYAPVTTHSPTFALDCEFSETIYHGVVEVTQFSLVNEKCEVLLETFVKPSNPILPTARNFKEIMSSKLNLRDVQQFIKDTIPNDGILVGHSLDSDLRALHLMHPYCIDTAYCYNVSGKYECKPKLQLLSQMFLGKHIQSDARGHFATEDAVVTMELLNLKLSKFISYGDSVISDPRPQNPIKGSFHVNDYIKKEKLSSIFANGTVIQKYRDEITRYLTKNPPEHNIRNTNLTVLNSNEHIIKEGLEKCEDNHLSICHVDLMEETDPRKKLELIERWTEDIFKNVPSETLVGVLFTGSETENGALLAAISD